METQAPTGEITSHFWLQDTLRRDLNNSPDDPDLGERMKPNGHMHWQPLRVHDQTGIPDLMESLPAATRGSNESNKNPSEGTVGCLAPKCLHQTL